MPRPLDRDEWPFSFLWGVAPQPPGHDNSFLRRLFKRLDALMTSHILASDYPPEPGIKRISHTIAGEIKSQDHQHDTKTWCEGKYGTGQ